MPFKKNVPSKMDKVDLLMIISFVVTKALELYYYKNKAT